MSDVQDILGLTHDKALTLNFTVERPHHEVEQIEDTTFINFKDDGVSLVLRGHDVVTAIQLYSEGLDEFSEYRSAVPGNLSFNMSLAAIRKHMGTPQQHGDAAIIPVFGMKPGWDKFDMGTFTLHVEYAPNEETVQMFTIEPHEQPSKSRIN